MKHSIPIAKLGPHGTAMAQAVHSCVHCGFCLPTCPTYQIMGEEMDSPRGRIVLMKQVLEGTREVDDAAKHLDACLGCLACETACPSGVEYRNLISPYRAWAEERRTRSPFERLKRWSLLRLLPFPDRFRFATRLGMWARPFRKLMPKALQPMLNLLPTSLPAADTLDDCYPAIGEKRARVALLIGCAQQVLAPEINRATIRVLQKQGVEVLIPRAQQCCGALAWHVGDAAQAKSCAAANVEAFPTDVDAILTNAAGCGSALHEYPLILGTDAVKDVAQFLHELGFRAPTTAKRSVIVAMQDACHLLHGQRVQSAPRRLLASIPGVTVKDIPDSEICCGSAGTYNIDQPVNAAELGRRKAAAIQSVQPDIAVTGNIGCLMQLRSYVSVPTLHTMVLIDELLAE
jgi:glycolate oxidase iron-sulfur subunit